MSIKVNADVLGGFIEEVAGYLPQLRTSLATFDLGAVAPDETSELYRQVHCIKGAASMVGLDGMSRVASLMEAVLEQPSDGAWTLAPEMRDLLSGTLAVFDLYVERILGETGGELPDLTAIIPAYHRHLQVPAEQDAAVIRQITEELKGSFEQAPPTATPPALPAVVEETAEEVSPELLEVFALEAEEHLRNVSVHLDRLKEAPENKTFLHEIRRSVHTLKGAGAMVGFKKITQLGHRMEDYLDLVYEGRARLTADSLTLLFDSSDTLQDLAHGKSNATTLTRLYTAYEALLAATPADADVETPAAAEAEVVDEAASAAAQRMGQYLRVPIERLDQLVKLVSELVITRTAFEQRMADALHQRDELQLSVDRLRRVSTKLETEYEASTLGSSRLVGVGGSSNHATAAPAFVPQHYGFDDLEFDRYTEFHLLSREMSETTADIQTVSNEMGHLHGDFDSYLNRQARLSSEIQDKLMRVRMVPLATIATQLHRTVRTVANTRGKKVALVLHGEETELDKTVLEEMSEPLLHLLRNAVDHGIETPATRRFSGKPESGVIRLSAYYEGTQVVLRLEDDGGGIDPELIRATAVKNGILHAKEAENLSDAEACNLLFRSGFSTAAEISEISGRGVGLDIVRTKVQKLKGTVTLTSEPGKGTTFFIRLPLTLAIGRALLVKSQGQTFAIPLPVVKQILRLDAEPERIGADPVLRVEGRVSPLYHLGKLLGIPVVNEEKVARPPVVLVDAGDRQIALVVDQLLGGREIVIKTLGSHVRQLRGVTGATLMGDGSVVLILNPAELMTANNPVVTRAGAVPHVPANALDDGQLSVMVVDDSPSVRRVVSNLIAKAGWTPLPAKDGLDALEILQRATTPPDVLLLDIEMPRMDGYELLATLRGQAAYRHTPVVMITSRAGDKHRRKALELGASAYVVKPYQDDALLATVRDLVVRARRAGRA